MLSANGYSPHLLFVQKLLVRHGPANLELKEFTVHRCVTELHPGSLTRQLLLQG